MSQLRFHFYPQAGSPLNAEGPGPEYSILKIYFYIYLCVCVCVHLPLSVSISVSVSVSLSDMCVDVIRGQKRSDPLELELKEAVSCVCEELNSGPSEYQQD